MELDVTESEPSRDALTIPVTLARTLPPGRDVLVERLEQHARAARGAFADNTVRALAADSRIFAGWCRDEARTMLPATPETVAAFIDAQGETKSRATLERYRSSIAALHRAAGLANPCADEIVRLAVKRLNRAKGRRQTQAEPLNRGSIERMLAVPSPDRLHRRVTEGMHETPLIALRNAALVAVAYDTLLRRSELVSLCIGDLERVADGSGTVLVRRSKADQEGEGAIKYLAPDTMGHVGAWLAAAKLTQGPMFRALTKGGRVGSGALGAAEVSRLFRDMAQAAELKLARLPSGHSTRVGATQDMFAAGFELLEVMQAGSWKTPAMPARYGERLRAQRGAARRASSQPCKTGREITGDPSPIPVRATETTSLRLRQAQVQARRTPYLRCINDLSPSRDRAAIHWIPCWCGGVLRLVRTLFIAAVGLTSLSACVGSDPQARLRAGSGASFASATLPMAESVEPAQRLTAVMPGDLLLDPGRRTAGIDPQAILTRSSNRVVHAAAPPPRRVVAHAAHIAGAPASVEAVDAGTFPRTSPFLAARLGPAEAPARPSPLARPTLTPLIDVEARAEVEQRAQANRDRRFDAQVRRASSLVCSGCVPTAGRKSTRAKSSTSETDD